MNSLYWGGTEPFTIGIMDEHGRVIEQFTAILGQEIPEKWIKVIRETAGFEALHHPNPRKNQKKQ